MRGDMGEGRKKRGKAEDRKKANRESRNEIKKTGNARLTRKVSPNFMDREDFSHLINSIKSIFRRVCGNTREVRFDFKHNEKSK
jgi:hypothetical protein